MTVHGFGLAHYQTKEFADLRRGEFVEAKWEGPMDAEDNDWLWLLTGRYSANTTAVAYLQNKKGFAGVLGRRPQP